MVSEQSVWFALSKLEHKYLLSFFSISINLLLELSFIYLKQFQTEKNIEWYQWTI